MTAPRAELVHVEYQNPLATMRLRLPVLVICNTPDEDLERNIRINSARDDLSWIAAEPHHGGIGIFVGGGPSVEDHLDDITALVRRGGSRLFAMNAASQYLRGHGLTVDYQVIADAKEETATLVDPEAKAHLFASQVHSKTAGAVEHPLLWHLQIGDVEQFFPAERVKRGGYALIGGGAAVGNTALCVAFAMGYREMHIFGYDSCHREKRSHAYEQPMNQFIPTVEIGWGGRTFTASVAMKAQAEKFLITSQALKQMGAAIHVYGDGLLQAMYLTPPENLTEQTKYNLMWQFDSYRENAPGEAAIGRFIEIAQPEKGTTIIDFGCGTGRAALKLKSLGFDVIGVDFASNCRDEEARDLPFVEWDLSEPCWLRAPYGFCTDVMEHIPGNAVDAVITNIMSSSAAVYFQISTVKDGWGEIFLGQRLHNTVRPHRWWKDTFTRLGFSVEWDSETRTASSFLVKAISVAA